MTYVDGFVLPVPKKNFKTYKKMANEASKVWKKHGALQYLECWGDDLKLNPAWKITRFPNMAKAKPDETVVFAFIIYKSRAHRDQVNAKVMKQMAKDHEKNKNKTMPFDMKKMAYGGFKTIVER